MSFAGKKANQSLISNSSNPQKKLKPLPKIVTVITAEQKKEIKVDEAEEIGGELFINNTW